MFQIQIYLQKAVRLLWPETCPFCDRVSAVGTCAKCKAKIKALEIMEPKCMRCGKPVAKEEQEYCHDCMHTIHYYDKGVSLWTHTVPVSTSIYRFKYHNQRVYGAYYAKEMLIQHRLTIKAWNPDLIIPIPLHVKRKRKRGYNQSELLGFELSRMLQVPLDVTSLRRIRNTRPQKQMTHQERNANVRNAFALVSTFEKVQTVLLLDDIYTTGNTIDEASKVLKRAGVEKIYFLTISIGQGY